MQLPTFINENRLRPCCSNINADEICHKSFPESCQAQDVSESKSYLEIRFIDQ
jgi:hypothetical protein